MDTWIYGYQIIETYSINIPTLQEWVLNGLTLYDRNLKPTSLGPNKTFYWETPIYRPKPIPSWNDDGQSHYYAGTQTHTIRVEGSLFRLSEVKEFTTQHGISRKESNQEDSELPEKKYTGRKEICKALGVKDWRTAKSKVIKGLHIQYNKDNGKPYIMENDLDEWKKSDAEKK